jgi:phosphatidate cytidylyltransferase
MLGGVVMVVVAYFWGAPALVTPPPSRAVHHAVAAAPRRRGLRPERHGLGLRCCLRAVPRLVRGAAAGRGRRLDFDRCDDGVQGIIVFILVTIASDIGGYVAGVLFGRHPMAPVISPKKSWEGFAGSVVFCVGRGVGWSCGCSTATGGSASPSA